MDLDLAQTAEPSRSVLASVLISRAMGCPMVSRYSIPESLRE